MANRPALKKIEEAASDLGVPKGSLRTAAEQHGLLVYIGRAVRIDPNDYQELINVCRGKPQGRASISAKTLECGSSATLATPTVQQAHATAAMLKKGLRDTSPVKVSSPAPVARIGSK
jgi:hypothetical protein